MGRPRHTNKEIEAAVAHAESKGWRVLAGGSHAWGFLLCRERSRDGCRVPVYSTPRNPEGHARRVRHLIDSCPHEPGGS
jgi:hypothetical protein